MVKKQQYFGMWAVIVQYDQVETGIYWYRTKKEAMIEYKRLKEKHKLTFLVRQVEV